MRTRRGQYLQYGSVAFTSSCPIPGVLHACCNSCALVLRRWELSFTLSGEDSWQPPKIFFDHACDILYFGNSFDGVQYFLDGMPWKERNRILKVAFHLDKEADLSHDTDGAELCARLYVGLHWDFSSITHLFLPEEDLDHDYDREEQGLPQQQRDPEKTVVAFYNAWPACYLGETETLDELEEEAQELNPVIDQARPRGKPSRLGV
jgi:hypothetical protein